MSQTILVASATANTGSKVVELLSAAGSVAIRALVRNPSAASAQSLSSLPNVTVVKGDFDDPASIKAALQGVSRAFLVSSPGEDIQYDREVAFIAAAQEAGLEAVVRISTANMLISLEAACVYAQCHAKIEKCIAEKKAKVIDLQPNWYFTNWLASAGEAKATGKITFPVSADHPSKTAMVDTRDVAGAAVAILLQPKAKLDEFLAAGRVQVHGPELLSFGDKALALSKATGKEIVVKNIPPDQWIAAMVGFGLTERFASSFADTILTVSGTKPPQRPLENTNSPLLLSIWQPKYTIADWAKDHASVFA